MLDLTTNEDILKYYKMSQASNYTKQNTDRKSKESESSQNFPSSVLNNNGNKGYIKNNGNQWNENETARSQNSGSGTPCRLSVRSVNKSISSIRTGQKTAKKSTDQRNAKTPLTNRSETSTASNDSGNMSNVKQDVSSLPEAVVQHEKCFICGQEYADPRVLICYHTFCLECLEEYIQYNTKDDIFQCVLCKLPMPVPKGGAQDVPRNFYVADRRSRKEKISCDLCGDRTVAKSFCHECCQNLCSYCTNFHDKLQATRHHHVTNVESNGNRKLRSRPKCPFHAQKDLEYFCNYCKDLVCVDCNMTDHKSHTCLEVSEVAEKFREHLQETITDQLYSEHATALLDARKGSKTKAENAKVEDEIIQAIEDHYKLLTNCLEHLKKELVAEAMQAFERHSSDLQKKRNQAIVNYQSFAAVYFFSKLLLQQGHDIDVVYHGIRLKHRLNQLVQSGSKFMIDKDMVNMSLKFVPGNIDEPNLSAMLGTLFGEKKHMDLRTRLLGKFRSTPGNCVVSSLAPVYERQTSHTSHTSQSRAWVCVSGDSIIRLYDAAGTCYRQVEFSHAVDDMTFHDGILYLTSNGTRYLRTVDEQDQKKVLLTTPLCPRGICVSRADDTLMVSMVKNDAFFTASLNDNFSIVQMTSKAEEKKMFTSDIFAYPARLAMTTQYLFVSDWLIGAVFALNENGVVAMRYPEEGTELAPRGICSDGKDFVYVIDIATETVHILKPDGTLHGILSFGDVTVNQPWSISCDKDNKLWIGCQDGMVYVFTVPATTDSQT